MAPPADENHPAESEHSSPQEEAYLRWLHSLTEAELDFLIGLRELAVVQSAGVGHPHLAHSKFHLGTLLGIGTALPEHVIQRLKQAFPVDPTDIFERLALLTHPGDADVNVSSSKSRSQPREDDGKKRKQMMKDG